MSALAFALAAARFSPPPARRNACSNAPSSETVSAAEAAAPERDCEAVESADAGAGAIKSNDIPKSPRARRRTPPNAYSFVVIRLDGLGNIYVKAPLLPGLHRGDFMSEIPSFLASSLNGVASASAARTDAGPSQQRDEDLWTAAKRFEAAFLAEMLKTAGVVAEKGAFAGGYGADAYRSFLADAYAESAVETSSFGLADALYRQMSEKVAAQAAEQEGGAP